MAPVVTFRLGATVVSSQPVPGSSPSFNQQLLEFACVDVVDTPLLRIDVAAGPGQGLVAGIVSGAVRPPAD